MKFQHRFKIYSISILLICLIGCVTNSEDEMLVHHMDLVIDSNYPIEIPGGFEVNLFAENLESPTSIQFPPDGTERLFVNELNSGKIWIFENGVKLQEPFLDLAQQLPEQVRFPGSRGLIGVEFHPDFETNGMLYLAYATSIGGEEKGFIATVRVENNRAAEFKIIQSDIPSKQGHQVQNIEIGPDKMLYISVGDAYAPEVVQDERTLNGKIIRLTLEGDVPADNPFGPANPVYALGFRNPYDLIFTESGELLVNDNGSEGNDTFYKVEAGSNAGWPVVEGYRSNTDFIQPLYVWENTVVPTGMHIYKGSQFPAPYHGKLFMVLYGVTTEGQNPYGKRIVFTDPRRLNDFTQDSIADFFVYKFQGLANPLDITEGPEGSLYVSDVVQGKIYSVLYTGN